MIYVVHGVEEASAFLIRKLKPIEKEYEDNEDSEDDEYDEGIFSLRDDIFINSSASG